MAFSLLLYKNVNTGVVWGMGVELAFSLFSKELFLVEIAISCVKLVLDMI